MQPGHQHAGDQAQHEGHAHGRDDDGDHRPEFGRVQGQAEVEEEEGSEHVAQRHGDAFDPAAVRAGAEHHPDQEGPDRIRHPDDLPDSGEQHGESEEEDGEQLIVLGAHQPGHDSGSPPGHGEHHDEKEEGDAQLQHDQPDLGLATEHDGDDGQVDRDENVSNDGHPEDHRGFLVGQPAQFDQELGDDGA